MEVHGIIKANKRISEGEEMSGPNADQTLSKMEIKNTLIYIL